MTLYRYSARDPGGSGVSGVERAASVEALAAELRSRGFLVLEAGPAGPGETGDQNGPIRRGVWPPRAIDVEWGFQQLATMLRGGLGLLEALRTVADQARRPSVARLWRGVAERIEQGSSLAGALVAQGKVFSPHVVQLARVGEATGELDAALSLAAAQLERSRHLRFTVLNALAYPATVMALAGGVAGFLVMAVIPKIQRYLGGRGRSLPAMTQSLLDVSAALQRHLPLIAVAVVASAVALWAVRRWPAGRLASDRWLLRFPVVGSILRTAGTASVARALGSQLSSGVPLLEALDTAARLPSNTALGARLTAARDVVLRGGSLAAGLSGGREFMPMLPRMLAVGESAGTLSQVLDEVARFHESQLLAAVRRLSALIEPAVILIVGGIVGFVYIAFFLALFSLAGRVR